MSRRLIAVVAFVWVVSLVSVAVWAQAGTSRVPQDRRDPTAVTVVPSVLAGEDIGFRPTGGVDKAGKVPGVFVVKIDGRWLEVAPVFKTTAVAR